jgi:hypothetical protein
MKLSLACLVLCPALASAAEAQDASISIWISVADVGPGTRSLDLTLSLVGEQGCSAATVKEGDRDDEVRVCREGGTIAAPILSFDVQRRDGHSLRHFKMRSRIGRKRALVGRAAEPPGGVTEVSASVQETGG